MTDEAPLPGPEQDTPDWLAHLRSKVTTADWDMICSKMIAKAADGDMKAIEFVERAVLPKERGDPTEKKVKTIRLILAEGKSHTVGKAFGE